MECIEARALKSSFLSEFSVKSTQQVLFDELFSMNGINGVSGDDFSVDVFLDLSNDDVKDGFVEEEEEESEEEEKDSLSVSSQDRTDDDSSNITAFSGSGDSGSLPAGELAVPVDDLENLEWLSQFVDDSVSEVSLLCPAGNLKEKTGRSSGNRSEPVCRPQRTSFMFFPVPVPAKSRSKRSRTSGRTWSGSESFGFILSNPVQSVNSATRVVKRPAKRQKKRPGAETGDESIGGTQAAQRRCSHCQVQKTPQWRTGPLGKKTLCNACGVRYKSGRLFPEYRPAGSPTFSGDVHSNSHRKVVEIRQKKESAVTASGLVPMVPMS